MFAAASRRALRASQLGLDPPETPGGSDALAPQSDTNRGASVSRQTAADRERRAEHLDRVWPDARPTTKS